MGAVANNTCHHEEGTIGINTLSLYQPFFRLNSKSASKIRQNG